MKKNYLILSFCLIPILASKCIDFEGDSWVTLKNRTLSCYCATDVGEGTLWLKK